MKQTWLARYWSLLTVACVRFLFVVTFSANLGGDALISYDMMLKGTSNLVIPPGYPFLIGLPFRLFFSAATLHANQGTFLFAVMVLQHVIAFAALVLLHKMVVRMFGLAAAHLTTLVVGLHWGMMAATSQIGSEWLQSSLIVAIAFLLVKATGARTSRARLLAYVGAAFLFAWAYLVKFNALYFALLFVAALAFADRSTWRRKLQYVAAIVAVFLVVVGSFKIFFQKPKTGTYALTHDRAWVLLFKSAYFCTPLTPSYGPNTKRLLLLNTLLPWDNKNVGSIPDIHLVAPDIEEYRKKYGYILTADDQTLDRLLWTTQLRADFNYFTAFSPTTYYLGLAEGDQLGVDVFKECVRANKRRYVAHVLSWTFSRLLFLETKDPFPLNVDVGFTKAGEDGWYWANGTTLKRNGTDPYDNPASYYAWLPGMPVFTTLRALFIAFPNWLVTMICAAGLVAAAARRRYPADWLLLLVGTLTFGFILASIAVFDFRWYEELVALMPFIATTFAVTLVNFARGAIGTVTRVGAETLLEPQPARASAAGPAPRPVAPTSAAVVATVTVPAPAAAGRTVRAPGTPRRAIVTGSAGLIGSECTRLLIEQGWQVVGVDNDMRRQFFGQQGSTRGVVKELRALSGYDHHDLDIRHRQAIRDLFEDVRPELVIHTAGQPSHDKAASIPYDDFDVNAVGTVNMLVAARDFARDAPFCFTSTNKVYGDRPNFLPLVEKEKRYDYADGRDGIDETLSIDACLHSLFGASKVSADVMCQEFGRYFQMPIGIFRAGCLTGPQHAAVELHGYLAYIVACALQGRPYTIFGYKGKQVRDQIHCRDVAQLFVDFHASPRCGEVYNLGGGRANSMSILETIDLLAELGCTLPYTYSETNRVGDHICYISDLTKLHAHFPAWKIQWDIRRIVTEMVERQRQLLAAK